MAFLPILRPAIGIMLLWSIVLGGVYPLLVYGVAQVAFPSAANGSLLRGADGSVLGSALIGQPFRQVGYFWSRPSATAQVAYNPMASGGSNLSVTSKEFHTLLNKRIGIIRQANPAMGETLIPSDLVTASASGLDPHISFDAAYFQAARVAKARGLTTQEVEAMILHYAEKPALGLFGKPRVNVLLLNLVLDKKVAPPPGTQ